MPKSRDTLSFARPPDAQPPAPHPGFKIVLLPVTSARELPTMRCNRIFSWPHPRIISANSSLPRRRSLTPHCPAMRSPKCLPVAAGAAGSVIPVRPRAWSSRRTLLLAGPCLDCSTRRVDRAAPSARTEIPVLPIPHPLNSWIRTFHHRRTKSLRSSSASRCFRGSTRSRPTRVPSRRSSTPPD